MTGHSATSHIAVVGQRADLRLLVIPTSAADSAFAGHASQSIMPPIPVVVIAVGELLLEGFYMVGKRKPGQSESRAEKVILRAATLTLCLCPMLFAATCKSAITKDVKSGLDYISADSLRGHVSFLASDLLEGRCTPSRGGDLAAEYIAAQFRRAGLTPAGDEDYFQTANCRLYRQPADGFQLKIEHDKQVLSIVKEQVWLYAYASLNLSAVPVVKLNLEQEVKSDELRGKVVAVVYSADPSEHSKQYLQLTRLGKALQAAKPAPILALAPGYEPGFSNRLEDPDDQQIPPPINIGDPAAIKLLSEANFGPTDLTVTSHLSAPSVEQVKLRNVVGVLPGSDPVLKDTCMLVTAHYDADGTEFEGGLKRVYPGADDDASGTASLIELASALARLNERPKRTIVFLATFGEEMNMMGSRYYVRHPVFPIAKTIADINLDLLGRSDSSKGAQSGNFWMTGFDYSDVPSIFQSAGKQTGIEVYKHDSYSDELFIAADNVILANMGIPAHSATVTTELEHIHGFGDVWQKLDYANMA